uniref:Putative N-acetylmuramoyl-L-alanine amidase n=1 Tax=viral metagenome TaxID=1070528 RepID=A0A6M3KRK9_9ZZZZ
MRKINLIIIHCSDSNFGDVNLIRKWHTLERHWSDIGYHYVILNGCRKKDDYHLLDDGLLEIGRPLEQIGAHVEGKNANSIGVCLIGTKDFTGPQFSTLSKLVHNLLKQFPNSDVLGHYEAQNSKGSKTCPNINMAWLRDSILDLNHKTEPNVDLV